MPNHCTNTLTFYGSDAELTAIRIALVSDAEPIRLIDFNRLIPMPPELRDVTSPVQIVTEEERQQAIAKRDAMRGTPQAEFYTTLPITAAMQADYRARYGADNWYDWATRNWGTKWNAYDVDDAWSMLPSDRGRACMAITFDTAWGPPDPVLRALEAKFPTVHFVHEFEIEGGCGAGRDEYNSPEDCDADPDPVDPAVVAALYDDVCALLEAKGYVVTDNQCMTLLDATLTAIVAAKEAARG